MFEVKNYRMAQATAGRQRTEKADALAFERSCRWDWGIPLRVTRGQRRYILFWYCKTGRDEGFLRDMIR
jgi:hypothetical protein